MPMSPADRGRRSVGTLANVPLQQTAGSRCSPATTPRDMALPGLDLHPLTGDRKGTWAVSVGGDPRVTFKFLGKDADSADYEDYH